MTEQHTHKWLILVAVGSALLMGTIDGSIVNVALPSLTTDLHTKFYIVQWAVLSFLMGLTILLLMAGRLGDMIGKKRVFTLGLIVFTLASALCGLAPGIYWLIAFRFLQAVGSAMIVSLGVAIVTETWPRTEHGKAIGISAGLISLGAAAGPALGGFILHVLSWRWIFFVNIPVGLLSLVFVRLYVPELRPKEHAEKYDIGGALAIGVTMLSFVLAMTFTQTHGLFSGPALGLLTTFAAAFGIFIWIESHVQHPMLDLSLFKNPGFGLSLLTGFATFVCISGILLIFPFYLQLVKRFDQQHIGLIMSVVPISLVILGPISGTLADRWGTRPVSLVGLVTVFVSYILMGRITALTTAAGFILLTLPNGMGMAIFQSPNNAAIMASAPRRRLGVANGMLSMSRTLGQLTGVSLMGAFFARRLQGYESRAVDVTMAGNSAIVRAMHDQAYLAAGIIAVGTTLVLWQARREWKRRQNGSADESEE
jgi:EmrB/QacA subfamily drug resistance transporter